MLRDKRYCGTCANFYSELDCDWEGCESKDITDDEYEMYMGRYWWFEPTEDTKECPYWEPSANYLRYLEEVNKREIL